MACVREAPDLEIIAGNPVYVHLCLRRMRLCMPPCRNDISGIAMQYIYTMNGVSKLVPPKRQIIKDISLSFFPAPRLACWPQRRR